MSFCPRKCTFVRANAFLSAEMSFLSTGKPLSVIGFAGEHAFQLHLLHLLITIPIIHIEVGGVKCDKKLVNLTQRHKGTKKAGKPDLLATD